MNSKIIFTLFLYVVTVYSEYFTSNKIHTEEIALHNGSIILEGTLSYPKTNVPLVIWIHGSGNIDRKGNQKGVGINANYIEQFKDSIVKNDIAFFSYDKRTANPKNAPFLKNIVYEDLVSDAKKVISFFKKDNRFQEIIVVGHSQGSLTAMLASEHINKFISISAPSKNIGETITQQVTQQNDSLGKITAQHIDELKKTGKIENPHFLLLSLFAKKNQPFLASWIKYNPVEEIKKITVPILIINGTEDLQVPVSNAKELKESAQNATLVLIPNMNHVLKIVQNPTENQQAYFLKDFPLSSKLVKHVVEFINK